MRIKPREFKLASVVAKWSKRTCGQSKKALSQRYLKTCFRKKYPVLKLHRFFFLKMNLIDKNNHDDNNDLIPRHVTGINDCLEANGLR